MTKNQSGFRPDDSVTNQLLSLVNDIHKAFDDKDNLEVRLIYLHMSTAFDKVWHEGLKQNGIQGKLLALFKNYLSNCKQRTLINGSHSSWGYVETPGLRSWTLIFLVYVNNLKTGIKSSVKFFADDTFLFSTVRYPMVSAEELNQDLGLISKWAHQWKMSFNPDPSKQAEKIVFSRKRNCRDHPPIFSNNFEVKRVSDHKHFGLILDSKLILVKHINKTARKGIGVIKHLAPYLTLVTKFTKCMFVHTWTTVI